MISSADQAERQDLRADVCIVGTGPSGQAVAAALAGSGHDVLMIDAGGRHADRWGRRMSLAAMPSTGRQYPNPGDQVSIRLGGTSDKWAIVIDPASRPVAGTGLRLCRLSEVDVEPDGRPGSVGWPIGLDELGPYYERAEALFGLDPARTVAVAPFSGGRLDVETFWAVDRGPFLEPDETMARMVTHCTARRLDVDRRNRISGLTATTGSGRTVRIEADAYVLALGTVQTTRLLLDSPWAEGGSVANSSGLVGRYLVDHPQLIIGQLALAPAVDLEPLRPLAPEVEPGPDGTSPVLRWPNLVTSADRSRHPGVARLATSLIPVDRIGRRWRLTNAVPRPLGGRTAAGMAAGTVADAVRRRRFDRQALRALPDLVVGVDEVALAAWRRHRRPRWSIERPHWSVSGRDAPRGFQIFAVAEQFPDPDNRIVLAEVRNSIGARRPRVEWRWSADDRRRAEAAADDVRQALAELGIGPVRPRKGRAAVHKINSHHAAGTTRLSRSPADGVVDPDLRAHDHPNLYIAGCGVFNSCGYANPTLTAVALALRLGDHLAGQSAPPP